MNIETNEDLTENQSSSNSSPNTNKEKIESGKTRFSPQWYYWIFAASGFSGLIYESIWARYLKLFLGHAAFAQVLVISVFLFGLALGSFLCCRWSTKIKNPLLVYAGIEAIVAIIAVYFHEIYLVSQEWALSFVLPQIDSELLAQSFKWVFSGMLIFPQSVLLGATFPLISSGLVRERPYEKGKIVSLLYFSNSIGASLGVLLSGFILIPLAGLPGTIAIAGIISGIIALLIWIRSYQHYNIPLPLVSQSVAPSRPTGIPRIDLLILIAAFITGLASFIYEIIWIRMISLLFGSSTHSFEVMLSAFIFGLAIGGWLIRRRIDKITEPMVTLGIIQVLMGSFALASLFLFPVLFDLISFLLITLPKNLNGYYLLTLSQLGLSMLLVLPATICAGMTLPLLTRRLMQSHGESAIGQVYALNTIGSVIGIFLALYILLPHVGIEKGITVGGVLDIGLGLGLLGFFSYKNLRLGVAYALIMISVTIAFGKINPQLAAIGVFRNPQSDYTKLKVIYYRDGKTASVSVTESPIENHPKNWVSRSIRTNGKVDAGLYAQGENGEEGYGGDEMTMVIAGLLPLLYRPDAKNILNIGFGSGLTSRTLLLSPNLRQLDNVEIEENILEGARKLGSRVSPVFNDTRNRFIIDDAKSRLNRFSNHYDIIISEPSNPWISGISNLFSKEFYQQVWQSLSPEGVFVQWLPLYEFSPDLLSSVVNALGESFADFDFYLSSQSDLIIVATKSDQMPKKLNAIFAQDEARTFLKGYQFNSTADLDILWHGGKSDLLPYLTSFPAPINSDYYPYVEQYAPLTFFLKTQFRFVDIALLPVPILEIISGKPYSYKNVSPARHSEIKEKAYIVSQSLLDEDNPDTNLNQFISRLNEVECPLENTLTGNIFLEQISTIVSFMMPVTGAKEMSTVWNKLEENECVANLLTNNKTIEGVYAQFWKALSLRDSQQGILLTESLLPHSNPQSPSGQILLLANMAFHYKEEHYREVIGILSKFHSNSNVAVLHAARFLGSHAENKL